MKPAARRVLLALLLACGVQAVHADSLQQLREFLTQTQSACGDFSETSSGKGPASHGPQRRHGTFEFARPGRFRWIYTSPYQQTIVSDGSKLTVYDPDLNQVTIKQLKGAIPALVDFLGSGFDEQAVRTGFNADSFHAGRCDRVCCPSFARQITC